MTSPADDHADKYNDPRVQISRRGILLGVAVAFFAVGGAALSIWARRTRLEQSTKFWGPEVIEAFQLAAELRLISEPDQASSQNQPVRLTGMPGLGHLRHVLLDDGSYLWESVQKEPISSRLGQSKCMILWFSDPEAKRFPDARVIIDLENGWIGTEGGNQQVQLADRFRNALPAFLRRIADYEPLRVEMRKKKDAGG